MGELARIWVRDFWRGWKDSDVNDLSRKLDDSNFYDGGIVRITNREFKAWPELDRRIMANDKRPTRASLLAWVEGRGLHSVIRLREQAKS